MTTTSERPRRPQPELTATERQQLSRPVTLPRRRYLASLPIAAVFLVWSFVGAEFDAGRLADGTVDMGRFLARLFPPSWDEFDVIVELLVETLQMAIVGTLLGAICSLLVAFAATATIAPAWVYHPARWLMNVLRSVPELVFALMFVSAVGLGPFAGILAMTLGSIGSIGKVYAEAMEAVDAGPVTAMQAVGASKRQVVAYAVLPQAAPALVSYTLLLFEGNVRGATILGLVGAGGIGLELTTAMRMYDYGHLSAIIISIVVLVTVIDRISAIVRRRLT